MAPPLFSRTLHPVVNYDTASDTDGSLKLKGIRDCIAATSTWRVIEDSIDSDGLLLVGGPIGSNTEDDRLLSMAYVKCLAEGNTINNAHVYGSSYTTNVYMYVAKNSGASSFDPLDLDGTTELLGGDAWSLFNAVMQNTDDFSAWFAVTSTDDLWIWARTVASTDETMLGYGYLGYDANDTLYAMAVYPGQATVSNIFWSSSATFLNYAAATALTNSSNPRTTMLTTGEAVNLARASGVAVAANNSCLTDIDGNQYRPNLHFCTQSSVGGNGLHACIGRQMHAGDDISGDPVANKNTSDTLLSISLPSDSGGVGNTLYLTEDL